MVGASGGIGAALVAELQGQGWQVTPLSRRDHGFDLTDEAAVQAGLGALQPGYDLIIVASGALTPGGQPPEKALRSLDPGVLAAQFAVNAIGPALVLKHALRLMPRDRRAVFAALSARVGSIGDNDLGGWYSYRAAKAALNQLIHTAAVEIRRSHPRAVCVALHPGTVATRFTAAYQGSHPTISPEQAARDLLATMAALEPAQSGAFLDRHGVPIAW